MAFYYERGSPVGEAMSIDSNLACLPVLVYLVIHDSGEVSLEHLLLSWYPSQNRRLIATW